MGDHRKILRDLAEDFGRTRYARAVRAPKPLDAPVIIGLNSFDPQDESLAVGKSSKPS
jgi:hypothetical protein